MLCELSKWEGELDCLHRSSNKQSCHAVRSVPSPQTQSLMVQRSSHDEVLNSNELTPVANRFDASTHSNSNSSNYNVNQTHRGKNVIEDTKRSDPTKSIISGNNNNNNNSNNNNGSKTSANSTLTPSARPTPRALGKCVILNPDGSITSNSVHGERFAQRPP